MNRGILRCSVTALAVIVSSCGGGDSRGSSTPVVVNPPTTQTPTPTITTAVATETKINLGALDNYSAQALPAHFDSSVAELDNTPANNPISDKVATLGRVLFNDKRLSFNDQISCASCHQQSVGFGDPDRFSKGFTGSTFTSAHSQRLGNIRYFKPGTMFWNKRSNSVEAQASEPLIDPVEMGFTSANGGIQALVSKLAALPLYQELFNFAFGRSTVTEERIQLALGQFQRAMISSSSRFDSAYSQVFDAALPNKGLNQVFPGFTAEENRGKQLFMSLPNAGGGACSSFHLPPTFALSENARSIGLDAGETTLFKSHSLKNVALSSHFMHDGRFSTLAQVVEHYNSGIQAGPSLAPVLQINGQPRRLNFSDADKAALVAFLLTLTDTAFITDPKFSIPFR